MSKSSMDLECNRRCKSRSHGQILTSAITKRAVSDSALGSFLKSTCANFTQALDFEGRTALHMAASRGRTSLMEWLVRHSSDDFVNTLDQESGYTPLHRSIFYGQIQAAVSLIKMGVNTDLLDKDDYKALEHAMLDRQYMYRYVGHNSSDVYVWGTNSNYTLGTGTQQQRNLPEMLTCFSRSNVSIKQVCLGKFHSVWVCEGEGADSSVWCCGQLARSGGPHTTQLRPALLKLPEPCLQAALTLNSTVFLLQNGTVIQYTHNSDSISQSTQPNKTSTIKLASVKPILKLSEPLGVFSGRSHVLVYNTHAVYTWGHNVGQLGHNNEEKFINTPRRVKISTNETTSFHLAACGDAASVVTTRRGDVYLLHKYICKKIAIKQINLHQVSVEAKVSEQGSLSRVTVLLLTNVGQLLIWQDTTNALTRCVFGLSHQTFITNVALTHDALYFTTKYGEAFVGTISRKTTQSTKKESERDGNRAAQPIRKQSERDGNKAALVKFLEKDDCTSVRLTRIPNIHRAVSIAVDSEGLNFACLQIKPGCDLTSLPELSPSSRGKHMDSLLQTAFEDDLLHDVVFKVGTRVYPAHMFIVASSSEYLYKMYKENMQQNDGEKPEIVLENVHPEVFDRILSYMYTGTCDVAELGPCNLKIRKEDLIAANKKEKESDGTEMDLIENASETSAFEVYKNHNKRGRNKRHSPDSVASRPAYCEPVKLVQAAAKRLQVLALHKLLDKFYYKDGSIHLKENATYSKNVAPACCRDSFPELVDTNVCSKEGQLVPAHKCILAARLEYFQGMFMHSWSESKKLSTVTLPISHSILLPLINFLYKDSCPEVENSESIDFICSMLIVADQLFVTRLREMCEVALANLITLRNCAELCQLAHTYNATQLKQCCLQYISLNLCALLEAKSLDSLEANLLEDISNYYCTFNTIMSSRVITPFYNAPSDEIINEADKKFPIDLQLVDEEYKNTSIIEAKKRNKVKKNEYTRSEKERMRYESVSSVDLSNDTSGDITLSLSELSKSPENKQEKWTKVPSSQQKQQKVVQARLKAITTAKDISNETQMESFTRLTKAASPSPNSKLSALPKENSFPELTSSGNLVINHVGPKLSQKQRKKLASQGTEPVSLQNLNDYIDKLSLDATVSKPKNPWKIIEPPVGSSSPNKAKAMEFNQILADQKKVKDDSSRIMFKPLALTQLEDKAIEELERFYNIHEIDDEHIIVRRIELQLVSSPQWVHTASK